MEWEVLAEFGYRARIGRSLEQTTTAAMGIRTEPIEAASEVLLSPIREEFGLRHVSKKALFHFLLGLLVYMKQRGGICHPFLDAYIASGGRNFLLTRQSYLPAFTDYTASPLFLCNATRKTKFDTLVLKNGRTWYQSWFDKTLGRDGLTADKVEQAVYPIVLDALVQTGVLVEKDAKGDVLWGLNPAHLYLSRAATVLETANQRDRLVVPKEMSEALTGMPSIAKYDDGNYRITDKPQHWLTRLYLQGEIHRVIAREHTGLLSREVREKIENEFISGEQPWYPNLLSATPTLEMGIDIGDLSSVLLCSVPPAQASYLQRIGRAGRIDGNAFNMTVAAGAPHDLYFYADPAQMMAGRIDTPGVFLNASTVIKRQLTAYCMDCWVATGIDERAVPGGLKPVLDNVEKGNLKQFPYNFIAFVTRHAPELMEGFLKLFEQDLSETSKKYLSHFIFGDAETDVAEPGADGLEMYLVKRLFELINERNEIKNRVSELKRYLNKLENRPQDESVKNEIRDVSIERGGLQAILREINGKQTMNFLTDEGLLPNYAFPEAGVTLRSVIFRKKAEVDENGKAYENVVFEYERAGAMAIGELAPDNTFYAGGRKVSIQQIDMQLSKIESWRFCPTCSHSEMVVGEETLGSCPRCRNIMWADAGQRVQMLRLRQVMANTSDRDSRIGDDSDNREPTFYTRQMLADFEKESVEAAWRIKSDRLPFGFEFIRKATFREMNFGEIGGNTELIHIAGEEASRPGFKLCKHCGMVQDKRQNREQKHAYACKITDKTDEQNLIDCLYLYREFTSEALRILLPVSTIEGEDQSLNSFIAALQLGLKRKFGGKVDHLRVMDYAEPISENGTTSDCQRRYLMLYDSVPGGTGYLHELMQSPKQLLDVFRQARDVMATCDCNQDKEKDGCYSCLYAFRNSHGMETTSRSRILELSDQFETVGSINEITVNPVLDSELETRFIEAIKRIAMGEGHSMLGDVHIHQDIINGKPGYFLKVGECLYTIEPQVNVNMADGVAMASKPDFMICSARSSSAFKPVALFMDGYKYHKDKVTDDSAKRMALVQSGQFWQWSLTWDDVHREFARSHTESRNPFAEGLQATMQPLRNQLATKLDVQGFEPYASSSPLMQLLLFLQQPDTSKWRGYAFTRILSWFDQTRMMTMEAVCKEHFNSKAPTRLSQFIEDAGQCAVGGIGVDASSDALQIVCAVPLDAIKVFDADQTDRMMSNIYLDTGKSSDESFKRSWQGFLKAYNLMQFLPRTSFTTHAGVDCGVYEHIEWKFADGLNDVPFVDAHDQEAMVVLEEVLDEFRGAVKSMYDDGLPLPAVLYELQDEHGEIIAEAELAWVDIKCAVMLKEQKDQCADIFIGKGWTVVELDADEKWLSTVRNQIQENDDVTA
jgi:DEAD/DEAH box helicase domain-containing protein